LDTAVLIICCVGSRVSVTLRLIAEVTWMTSLRVGSSPWVWLFIGEIYQVEMLKMAWSFGDMQFIEIV
jgi:hypothetical protein